MTAEQHEGLLPNELVVVLLFSLLQSLDLRIEDGDSSCCSRADFGLHVQVLGLKMSGNPC